MRLTNEEVPVEDIDTRLFKYYEVERFSFSKRFNTGWGFMGNANQAISTRYENVDKKVRDYIKQGVYDDFGYDIYSLFSNKEEENFRTYEEIYDERLMDYSNYYIRSLGTVFNDDIDRQEVLRKFSESKLYEELMEKYDNNLDRTEEVMKLMKDEAGDSGKNAMAGSDSMNQALNTLSEVSNMIGDRDAMQELREQIKGNKNIHNYQKQDALDTLDKIEKQGMSSGAGNSKSNVFSKILNMLLSVDLVKYMALNVGNLNQLTSTFESKDEFVTAKLPTDGIGYRKIRNSEEISRVSMAELALDDDIFYAKFLNGDVMVKEYLKKRKIGQAMYVLIDVSGSMNGLKELFSKSIISKLMDKVVNGEAVYFMRTFDDDVSELYRAETQIEADRIRRNIVETSFDGGGTNIEYALKKAIRDIKEDKEKFKQVDLLLISDGDCQMSITKEALGDIRLHSFIIESTERDKDDMKYIEQRFVDLHSKEIDPVSLEQEFSRKGMRIQFNLRNVAKLAHMSETFNIVNPVCEIEDTMPALAAALRITGRN